MKIKLDENVHGDVTQPLRALGHDVSTVHDEKLAGSPDTDLAVAVKAERRCLFTFDLDFSDPRKFPPSEFAGLVVLRIRVPTSRSQLERVTRFLAEKPELVGKLWIIEETRARNWTP